VINGPVSSIGQIDEPAVGMNVNGSRELARPDVSRSPGVANESCIGLEARRPACDTRELALPFERKT